MADERRKKPFYKRIWFWILAIIVVIALTNCGNGDDDDQKTAPATNKKDKTEEKAEKAYGIGDQVKVGDMQYKVNSKDTATQVGPSALPEKANGRFIIINVDVKNNGNEAVTVDSSFFKLKRGDKTYEADAAASLSANQSESGDIQNSFLVQQLNPDSEMSGKVVFDVAPDIAKANNLQLQVQTGAFGTETEVINLK
ncbi:DUF4352 domain-containing protein [Bacillus massilinigeriensis]|uniref:DUF4352 domain-containing protein n=1 Tax=Bacillus massilionigeriensis TaxID=1805475 RepID=UPI00096B0E5F|nr:DUF4352 domain-containing protein [Bacillus massilionigeriensis]